MPVLTLWVAGTGFGLVNGSLLESLQVAVIKQPAAEQLIEGLEGKTVAGDKAYIGAEEITKPKRKNMKEQDDGWSEALARARKRTRLLAKVPFFN